MPVGHCFEINPSAQICHTHFSQISVHVKLNGPSILNDLMDKKWCNIYCQNSVFKNLPKTSFVKCKTNYEHIYLRFSLLLFFRVVKD